MAAPLRHALRLLTWAAVALIYLPLLPAAALMALPALRLSLWQSLFADPQFGQALAATLVSTLLSVGGALIITLTVVAALWPSGGWRRLAARLPLLLAVPHVAFATAALLLFAESGWLSRLFPLFSPPIDRYGIGLGLTMAMKESAFLLWVVYGLLGEKRLAEQATVLKSLGYGRWQCLTWLVLPTLLPALSVVLLATAAWSLSAVDVALVIGPGNPPTLAVLAWQWLSQGDERQQAKGALASLILLLALAMMALAAWGVWRLWRRRIPPVEGIRRPQPRALAGKSFALLLPLCGVACALLLAAAAQNSQPVHDSVGNSLWLGLCSAAIGAVICLLWLPLGPSRFGEWIWLPLILPALPLVDGQYQLALYTWLDGERLTVLWGHLLWVVPWMLFILRPAWRARDPRAELVARTLGWQRGRIFWLVTLPALTSEAVALSSGGDTSTLAAQALWQLLLPALFFAATALLAWLIGRYRQGLR